MSPKPFVAATGCFALLAAASVVLEPAGLRAVALSAGRGLLSTADAGSAAFFLLSTAATWVVVSTVRLARRDA